jgi:hypothetical protein
MASTGGRIVDGSEESIVPCAMGDTIRVGDGARLAFPAKHRRTRHDIVPSAMTGGTTYTVASKRSTRRAPGPAPTGPATADARGSRLAADRWDGRCSDGGRRTEPWRGDVQQ